MKKLVHLQDLIHIVSKGYIEITELKAAFGVAI